MAKMMGAAAWSRVGRGCRCCTRYGWAGRRMTQRQREKREWRRDSL